MAGLMLKLDSDRAGYCRHSCLLYTRASVSEIYLCANEVEEVTFVYADAAVITDMYAGGFTAGDG